MIGQEPKQNNCSEVLETLKIFQIEARMPPCGAKLFLSEGNSEQAYQALVQKGFYMSPNSVSNIFEDSVLRIHLCITATYVQDKDAIQQTFMA